MSIAVIWEITCDHPKCEEVFTQGGVRSQSAARREARKEGWGRWKDGYEGDWCPRHRSNQPRRVGVW